MKLITKEIATKLAAAYARSAETGESGTEIVAKFFTPWGGATWYVTEGGPLGAAGELVDDVNQAVDWHLYGFCDIGDSENAELGYVLLSQLQELRGPFGLRVERDLYFSGTMADVMAKYGRAA